MIFRSKIALVLLLVAEGVLATNYCATFSSSQAGGANGFFALSINPGSASYYYDLDLTSLTTTCDLSQGLLFYLYNNWNIGGSDSASGSSSCGVSSVGASSPVGCSALNRTVSRGYKYSCNPNVPVSQCEVGDLSGKFGGASPLYLSVGTSAASRVTKRFVLDQSSPLMDYQPPYAVDFRTSNRVTRQMWSSIVFHCPADKSPLVCAKFTLIPASQTSACSFPTDGTSSGYSSAQSMKSLNDEGIAAAVISAFFLAYVLVTVIFFCRRRFGPKSQPQGGESYMHKNETSEGTFVRGRV
jgi:hypothetical protein